MRGLGLGLIIIALQILTLFALGIMFQNLDLPLVMMYNGLLIGLGTALVVYSFLKPEHHLTKDDIIEILRDPEFNTRDLLYKMSIEKKEEKP